MILLFLIQGALAAEPKPNYTYDNLVPRPSLGDSIRDSQKLVIQGPPMIEIRGDGKVFIRGKLMGSDRGIYRAMQKELNGVCPK